MPPLLQDPYRALWTPSRLGSKKKVLRRYCYWDAFFSEGQTGAKSGWLALWTGLAVLVGFVGNSVRSKISDGNLAAKHVAFRLSLDWCTALELRRGPFESYEFDTAEWSWYGTLQELEFTAFLTNDYIYHVGIQVYGGICGTAHCFISFTWRPFDPRAMFCAWMSLYSLEWEFLYYTSTSSFGGQAWCSISEWCDDLVMWQSSGSRYQCQHSTGHLLFSSDLSDGNGKLPMQRSRRHSSKTNLESIHT